MQMLHVATVQTYMMHIQLHYIANFWQVSISCNRLCFTDQQGPHLLKLQTNGLALVQLYRCLLQLQSQHLHLSL